MTEYECGTVMFRLQLVWHVDLQSLTRTMGRNRHSQLSVETNALQVFHRSQKSLVSTPLLLSPSRPLLSLLTTAETAYFTYVHGRL